MDGGVRAILDKVDDYDNAIPSENTNSILVSALVRNGFGGFSDFRHPRQGRTLAVLEAAPRGEIDGIFCDCRFRTVRNGGHRLVSPTQ